MRNERVKFRRHVGAGAPVLFPTATAGSIYGDVAERGGLWSASYALIAAATAAAIATLAILVVVVILVIVVKSSSPSPSPPPRLGRETFDRARPPEKRHAAVNIFPVPITHGQFYPSPLYPRNARRSTLYLFTYRNISRTRGRPAGESGRTDRRVPLPPIGDSGFARAHRSVRR